MNIREQLKQITVRRLAGCVFVGLGGGFALLAALGVATQMPNLVIAGFGLVAIAGAWALLDYMLRNRFGDRKNFPARPEFYDFGLLNQPMHAAELGGCSLKAMNFVVFDTETTGLKPSEGDEIVSIAGVRVRNGRIEANEAFSRLVNPGFPIPKASIRFHGITDQMVDGEAAISEVLPQFHAFVGDALLVAHNAAFDMKFLKLKETASAVVFDQIVLDSLLLSVFLDHDSHNHTLDAIAERLGVTVEGRHTALGDALVTAAVFVRMLDRLEARGITTVRQAIDASNGVAHIRKMQEQF